MSKECIIEKTDRTFPRLTAAAKSANEFYQFESDRLAAEVRLFNEELDRAGYDDLEHLAELLQALEENAVQRAELETGWANSSLRRKLSPGQNRSRPCPLRVSSSV